MIDDINKSIYEYARDIDKQTRLLSFLDVYRILLKDLNCIVCMESAADLLGYSNGGFRHQIYVYSLVDFNKPYIKCFIVKDLNNIPFIDRKGIKVSPIEIAIKDMLEKKETDPQILYETFANYYFDNNKSYKGLELPKRLSLKAKHFKEEGALYYEQWWQRIRRIFI